MACASKIGKRLGCFLPRPGLIPEVDGNGSGGPENRQGCIRERLKVLRTSQSLRLPWASRDRSGNSPRRRGRRSDLPNFWTCRPPRRLELPVAGSHWPSMATDPEGQPTEYLEEPPGFCSDEILFGGRNRRNAMRGVFLV